MGNIFRKDTGGPNSGDVFRNAEEKPKVEDSGGLGAEKEEKESADANARHTEALKMFLMLQNAYGYSQALELVEKETDIAQKMIASWCGEDQTLWPAEHFRKAVSNALAHLTTHLPESQKAPEAQNIGYVHVEKREQPKTFKEYLGSLAEHYGRKPFLPSEVGLSKEAVSILKKQGLIEKGGALQSTVLYCFTEKFLGSLHRGEQEK